ncbi:MAG TPA: maleylpyruvate isomerase N-terminal domain-containing protein [Acidimicrobiia bacterium]|nr:maleylpyruvate isomerase N-terminal domain-containing protein [Acidimicrobiia bacterium]
MAAALERAGGAFVALLRSLTREEGGMPIPGMRWTVTDTAIHMLNILRRGMGDRRRGDTLAGLAELNDLEISEVTVADVHEVADLLEADVATYAGLLGGLTDDAASSAVIDLHAGVRSDIPTGLSYQLFDYLAHGYDIATATHRSWDVPAPEAALVLRAALPALGPWVRPEILAGARQRTAFLLSDQGVGLEIVVGGGTYRVQQGPRDSTDWTADPVELFMAMAGRMESAVPEVARVASWYEPI